jgi:hypothetical protein
VQVLSKRRAVVATHVSIANLPGSLPTAIASAHTNACGHPPATASCDHAADSSHSTTSSNSALVHGSTHGSMHGSQRSSRLAMAFALQNGATLEACSSGLASASQGLMPGRDLHAAPDAVAHVAARGGRGGVGAEQMILPNLRASTRPSAAYRLNLATIPSERGPAESSGQGGIGSAAHLADGSALDTGADLQGTHPVGEGVEEAELATGSPWSMSDMATSVRNDPLVHEPRRLWAPPRLDMATSTFGEAEMEERHAHGQQVRPPLDRGLAGAPTLHVAQQPRPVVPAQPQRCSGHAQPVTPIPAYQALAPLLAQSGGLSRTRLHRRRCSSLIVQHG